MAPTKRQQEILNFIKRFISSNGYPPTRGEIADNFGFASANGAVEHLKLMEKKGLISIAPKVARGIIVR